MGLLTQLMLDKVKQAIQSEELRLTDSLFCGSISVKFNFLNGLFRTLETEVKCHERIENTY